MRTIVLALTMLAACSPAAPTDQSGAVAPAATVGGAVASVFPNLFQGSYRADATITQADGQSMNVAMIRDGQRVRMEMSTAQGPMVVVSNRETGESFMIVQNGGRTMVMRNPNMGDNGPDLWWEEAVADQMTAVGPCTHLGEQGVEWSRSVDQGAHSACVTADGIILWGAQDGRTTWQTTSIQRGPQDAAQFAMPAGAPVVDLGAGLAEAMRQTQNAGE